MAEWSGILATTIHNFVRDVEEDVARNRKVLAMLKSRGKIEFNFSGDLVEWRIRYKRQNMQGMSDNDTLTFARNNRWKKASLDWRGYAATDAETKKERLMNKGREAIVNRFSEITQLLMEDIEENFCDEFYVNGNASGNSKRVHGIESFMGTTGSAVSGTPVMAPSATYAGLSTALGNYGGSWTGNWPKGIGSPEYDFYSPTIVDYTSSLATASGGFAVATATWAARCLEAMRYGLTHSMKNKSAKGAIDFVNVDSEMFRLFKEALAAKERIVVERNQNAKGLQGLGFTDTVNYDGADVTFEYGTPANVGYGWNIDQMGLRSLNGQMFSPEGPDYDIASQSWRFSIDFYGNLFFRPRYFMKLQASGTNGA